MDSTLIKQPFKLPHPVSGFTFFTDDQVLTADHLNQLIHYLDYQERKNTRLVDWHRNRLRACHHS
ncbi:MAG: hypothetical protein HC767_06945 [Akkermansiaceae bacterium]|nr:hypothetical protein [Akkermansiaceae bacterium]